MNIKELVKNADNIMKEEAKKYNPDIERIYDIALEKGEDLANKYNANLDIIKIGIALMDSKLPYSQKLGTPKKHTEMAVEATIKLLEEYEIDDKIKENIIHCVKEHHGVESYYSIESEICANADCYKFLSPKGVFSYCSLLARRHNNLEKELEQLESKMDEKHNIASLEEVKNELNDYYHTFKKLLSEAKK